MLHRFTLDLNNPSEVFYRGLYQAEDASKILIFASERVLKVASSNNTIGIQSDATFKILPSMKDAYQILIINYQVDRRIYSMVYAIMERKTTLAYKKVFEVLKELLGDTVIGKSMTDYEPALENANKTVNPDVENRHCFFHFSKAVNDYAYNLGLFKMANDNNTIKVAINYASCLALLPQQLISAGISRVEEKLTDSPKCRKFTAYLRRNWVNKTNISVFGDKVRTNNACESLHRRLLCLIGKPHSNVFDFLIALQRFDNRSSLKMHQDINNICTQRKRNKEYERKDQIIEAAEAKLKVDHDVEAFLCATSQRATCEFKNKPLENSPYTFCIISQESAPIGLENTDVGAV